MRGESITKILFCKGILRMEKKRKNHVHLRITVEKESIDNIIRDNKLAFLYDTINEIEKKVYTYDEMD